MVDFLKKRIRKFKLINLRNKKDNKLNSNVGGNKL